MDLQLIIVVEANKKSKSDWIYIKDTIDHFYQYDPTEVRLSPVYMDGKGKYKIKEREIRKLISGYAYSSRTNKNRQSYVIYCFDCDEYDIKQEDNMFLQEAKRYCDEHGYEFVWFCKDIERVYLGRKIDDSQKTKEAAAFKARKLIAGVDKNRLSIASYRDNTSNILKILDTYLKRKSEH